MPDSGLTKMINPLFIYLVQGASENLGKFRHLISDRSDLLLLSYDEPFESIDGHIESVFFPDSTWAEGRNELLKIAYARDIKYEYFILLDDDVEIIKGSFVEFENFLLKKSPMMAVPLCDQISETFRFDPSIDYHHPVAFDQIVQAYHRSVLEERLALPYKTELDKVSWWYACQINQYLTLRFYRGRCAQYNLLEIRNARHGWNEKDNTSNSELHYMSGVTKAGLELCANLIVDWFGEQPRIINSLFHPRFTPKERYGPSFTWIFSNIHKMNFFRILRKLVAMFLASLSKIYLSIFSSDNLIKFNEFR